jgi:hypothetical protein
MLWTSLFLNNSRGTSSGGDFRLEIGQIASCFQSLDFIVFGNLNMSMDSQAVDEWINGDCAIWGIVWASGPLKKANAKQTRPNRGPAQLLYGRWTSRPTDPATHRLTDRLAD